MSWRHFVPRVPNRELIDAALRSEGLRSRVPRLAGTTQRELTERLQGSDRFYQDFNAAINAAWAMAHGEQMPDGSDPAVVMAAIRERVHKQRADDHRRARERQEKIDAQAAEARRKREVAARSGVEAAKGPTFRSTSFTPPFAAQDASRKREAGWDEWWARQPWVVRVPVVVVLVVAWPLFRPIYKTDPKWQWLVAILYWGSIAILVTFVIVGLRH